MKASFHDRIANSYVLTTFLFSRNLSVYFTFLVFCKTNEYVSLREPFYQYIFVSLWHGTPHVAFRDHELYRVSQRQLY